MNKHHAHTITIDRLDFERQINAMKEAAYALEGLRQSIDRETCSPDPQLYTIGGLAAGIGVVSEKISLNLERLRDAAGMEGED